jgi:hypothetical protein
MPAGPASSERRAYRIEDLPLELADAIEKSVMNSSHGHLDVLLDGCRGQPAGIIAPFIGDKLEEIRGLCRVCNVRKLEAFGFVVRQV